MQTCACAHPCLYCTLDKGCFKHDGIKVPEENGDDTSVTHKLLEEVCVCAFDFEAFFCPSTYLHTQNKLLRDWDSCLQGLCLNVTDDGTIKPKVNDSWCECEGKGTPDCGMAQKPIFQTINLTRVIVDELHLGLRITDRLLKVAATSVPVPTGTSVDT